MERNVLCAIQQIGEYRQKRKGEIMEKKQIKFEDLSWPVKLGVVGGIFAMIIYALTFLVGFIYGVLITL